MMSPHSYGSQTIASLAFVVAIWVSLPSCRSARASSPPSIEITTVPEAGDGTPEKLEEIAGRVKGALPGERVVVFALSGVWWGQPEKDRPVTTIQADSRWNTTTHPGSVYAALLVDERYRPPLTVNALPDKGGPVLAVVMVKGSAPSSPPPTLQFSGYQWEVRRTASS